LIRDASHLPHPSAANIVAWVCAVGPDGLDNYAPAIWLAEQAVALVPKQRSLTLNTLATVLYRAGRYEDAIKRVNESFGQGQPTAHDCILLSMIHRRMNQAAEAEKWLTKAKTLRSSVTQFWLGVEIDLMLKEAATLKGG
jgi:uncharacterized protein HemY